MTYHVQRVRRRGSCVVWCGVRHTRHRGSRRAVCQRADNSGGQAGALRCPSAARRQRVRSLPPRRIARVPELLRMSEELYVVQSRAASPRLTLLSTADGGHLDLKKNLMPGRAPRAMLSHCMSTQVRIQALGLITCSIEWWQSTF